MILNRIVYKYKWDSDYDGEFECQYCGNIEKHLGHDISFFYTYMLPDWECEVCGKSTTTKKEWVV